jgi:hypothetical protein
MVFAMVFAMKFDITCGCLDTIFIFVFLKIVYNNIHLCVHGIKQPLQCMDTFTKDAKIH